MRQAMTNPAQIVLFGNPPRATRRTTKRKTATKARKKATTVIIKENPVAKKKSKKRGKRNARTAAQKRATRNLLKLNRARRSGKSKGKAKGARRSSKRRRARARHVATSAGATVVIHKVKKGKVSRVHARRLRKRAFRRVRVNPGAGAAKLGFLSGLTGVVDNVKQSAKQGMKGYALLGAGAAGAVFGGALMQRATTPIAEKFAPALLTNPFMARLFAAANFYATGWAVQRFIIPAKHKDVKRGILAGAAVTAILEIFKPGLVRGVLVQIPGVGSIFGQTLAGLESDLGAYVDNALNGGHHISEQDVTGRIDGYESITMSGYEGTLACDAPDTTDELVTAGIADDGSGSY